MCGRDFIRRRCESSKKAFLSKLRRMDSHKASCRSVSRATRSQIQRREGVDLFCSEFLPLLDPQICHPAGAEVTREFPVPPMTDEPTAAAHSVPSTLRSFNPSAKSPSDHVKSGLRHDIDHKSQIISLRSCAADKITGKRKTDAAVWHNFCPDPGVNSGVDAGERSGRHYQKAETCTQLGISRQSNFLPCGGWAIQPRGPFGSQSQKRPLSSDRPTTKKLHNPVPTSPVTPVIENGPIQTPGHYSCTFKFCEVIGVLLERETEACYQLSKPYVEKLKEIPIQKFQHNHLRTARRRIVTWIFEVVRLLHLSSLTAAHAVSILDRYLAQNIFSDPQDEANTDIRLAATACVWIAAKLEDSDALDLSSVRSLSPFDYDEEKIREMEVSVLKTLGWRILAATACDFVANMVAQLPTFGLPPHLLRPVRHRSEEIIQGILSGARLITGLKKPGEHTRIVIPEVVGKVIF